MAPCGCLPWQSSDGTRHTLILEIGVVSAKEAGEDKAIALRAQTPGSAVRPPLGGLVQATVIHPGWEVGIQAESLPGQHLTLTGEVPSRPDVSISCSSPLKEESS